MKKSLEALKLYAKTALHPAVVIMAVFFMVIMLVLLVFDPEEYASEEYLDMIGSVQIGHIGIYFLIFAGGSRVSQNKFFASSKFAKTLYTTTPVMFIFLITLAYDAVIAAISAAVADTRTLSDFLVFDSLSSAAVIIGGATYGKKKLGIVFALPYFLFLTFPMTAEKIGFNDNSLGLSLPAAFAAAAGIYILSIVFSVIITRTWWKTGDKFYLQSNYIRKTMS